MVRILIKFNSAQTYPSFMANLTYLLFQRTFFVIGAAFAIMPFILKSAVLRPLIPVLESSFWYPLARLSYGAYLSHCIFMLFRTYNTERGVWADEFDTFLFFFAYLTFAYLFSFLTTVLI